jgi:hypothetical protein
MLRVQLKCDGTRWRTGRELRGKLADGVGSQYCSHYLGHGVSNITTADAHTSAASSRLNWRPRRFKWTRPFRRYTKSGLCACAVTFQMHSTTTWLGMWHEHCILRHAAAMSCLLNEEKRLKCNRDLLYEITRSSGPAEELFIMYSIRQRRKNEAAQCSHTTWITEKQCVGEGYPGLQEKTRWAVPCVRWSVAGITPRKLGFNPRPVRMGQSIRLTGTLTEGFRNWLFLGEELVWGCSGTGCWRRYLGLTAMR